ncbi:MAG: hypothetical protein JSS22_21000 [Proteobacteria bacterium]|nr:hypothetical protein [Pseudomonadota bacterium]
MKFSVIVLMILIASPALADDCKPVVDALTKLTTTPNHQVITGKQSGELITTADTRYVLLRGEWRKSAYDSHEALEMLKDALSTSKLTCTAKPVTVNNEAAMLYNVHKVNEDNEASDSQIWIATATGLPAKETMKPGEVERTVIFDYKNVKAPL